MTKVRVSLVDQGVWKMDTVSMPLSLGHQGYGLHGYRIRSAADIQICSFRGSDTASEMCTHYSHRTRPTFWPSQCSAGTYNYPAVRFDRLFPAIDVVANGEGEFIFRDILEAYLGGIKKSELDHIPGISFQRDGRVITTAERPRIANLDDIPSPSIEGTLPYRDKYGKRSTLSSSSKSIAAVLISVRSVTGAAP
jgi:radical SAM C-methyltransferase